MMENKFELTESDMRIMIAGLDDTAGHLIKESTLKYWIEHFVNKEILLNIKVRDRRILAQENENRGLRAQIDDYKRKMVM